MKTKTIRVLTTLFLTFCSIYSAQAQLMSWQFGDTASVGSEASYLPSYTNPYITATPLVRGAGLVASGFTRGFSSTDFTLNGTKDSAIAKGDYYQVGLTVGTGCTASLFNIDARLRRSSAAAANAYRWMYSLNGGNYIAIDTADVSFITTTADGDNQVQIMLNNITALQYLTAGTTVTLRLYLWGATTITSTVAFGRQAAASKAPSLAIGGRVTPTNNKTLLGWQFGNPASVGDEPTFGATFNDSLVIPSSLTRGAGADTTLSTLPRGFVGSNFSLNGTKVDAITNGDYYQFKLKAAATDTLALSTLDCRLRKSSAGANTYHWMYSLDSINFTEIGAADQSFVSTYDGVDQPQLDLSTIIALQAILPGKTVTFRLYAWGATTATGTFAIGRFIAGSTVNSLEVQGKKYINTTTTTPPPPPPPATGVTTVTKENQLSVYPNPVVKSCVIMHPEAKGIATVTVTDIQGRVLINKSIAAGETSSVISLDGLAAGNYMLVYYNGTVKSATLLQKQ